MFERKIRVFDTPRSSLRVTVCPAGVEGAASFFFFFTGDYRFALLLFKSAMEIGIFGME